MGLPLLLTRNNLDHDDTYQMSLATDEDVTRACAEVEQRLPGNTEIVLQKAAEPNSSTFVLRSRRDTRFSDRDPARREERRRERRGRSP